MIKINYEKMCTFYVSKNHLIVIILKYLEKRLERNTELTLLLKDNFKKEVENIIEKMDINEEIKNKIIKEFKRRINKKVNRRTTGVVIVQGDYEYIKRANKILEKNKKVEIINCFKFEDFEANTKDILRMHYKIINTLGKQEISQVFTEKNYGKNILT